MKLTPKQAHYLLHIHRHGTMSSKVRPVAKQLEKKGLVSESTHNYERYEWGRKVATLSKWHLTAEGEKIVKDDEENLKSLRAGFLNRDR